jgi:hypothetical protein
VTSEFIHSASARRCLSALPQTPKFASCLHELLLKCPRSVVKHASFRSRLRSNIQAERKLGQAFGPLGLNMGAICKEINEVTSNIRAGVPLCINLSYYYYSTYKLDILSPPSWMLKRAAGIAQRKVGQKLMGSLSVSSMQSHCQDPVLNSW